MVQVQGMQRGNKLESLFYGRVVELLISAWLALSCMETRCGTQGSRVYNSMRLLVITPAVSFRRSSYSGS